MSWVVGDEINDPQSSILTECICDEFTDDQIACHSDSFETYGSICSVQGRLKKHASFWLNELEASKFVRDIITSGYRLPFIKFPPSIFQKNHRIALNNKSFVEQAIEELLKNKCIIEVEDCPIVCSSLLVVTNDQKKQRLYASI